MSKIHHGSRKRNNVTLKQSPEGRARRGRRRSVGTLEPSLPSVQRPPRPHALREHSDTAPVATVRSLRAVATSRRPHTSAHTHSTRGPHSVCAPHAKPQLTRDACSAQSGWTLTPTSTTHGSAAVLPSRPPDERARCSRWCTLSAPPPTPQLMRLASGPSCEP